MSKKTTPVATPATPDFRQMALDSIIEERAAQIQDAYLKAEAAAVYARLSVQTPSQAEELRLNNLQARLKRQLGCGPCCRESREEIFARGGYGPDGNPLGTPKTEAAAKVEETSPAEDDFVVGGTLGQAIVKSRGGR